MEHRNQTEALAYALAETPEVRSVTRGWPQAFTQDTLPCIALALAGEQGIDYREDKEYLTETEYYVRVFAKGTAQMDRIARAVARTMEALGYVRALQWEDFSEDVKQTAFRYRRVGG